MPASLAAPPPAPPTPAAAPAPKPSPAPAAATTPAGNGDTPMARMRSRMADTSVEADLSDPNPERTVRERKRPASPPKPAEPASPAEPARPAAETGDPLEQGEQGETAPPARAAEPPKPEDEALTESELKAEKPPAQAGPWKLKKYWEKRAAAVELERNQLKEQLSKLPNIERLEDIEKRNKELEEEIRFHNYAKSQEYQDKYQKPYEEAWQKAIADLSELEVLNDDGTASRKATTDDLLALAKMPLGEARKIANQKFGDSANDVMMHRQRIRDLADAQHRALDEARKTGADRQTQMTEKMKSVQAEVTSMWNKFNEEDAAKLEYLKPKESDTEWNEKLDKAKTLVDSAFSQNATDPSLSPEQRAKAVRAHAAVRNRAIAYSGLKLENNRLKAQLKERDDKLKQYEESEPTAGQSGGGSNQPKPAATPMERMRQRMHAASVPVQGQYF